MEATTIQESDDLIDLSIGVALWEDSDGKYGIIDLQEDYRVGGEVWRVHLSDPDPLPSNPHAHCIGGRAKWIGKKLHLGTRQLFTHNNKPLEQYLDARQFGRLIDLVARKFPHIKFPLEA